MAEAHAYLAPSSAGTWGPGGCSAFPRMAAAYPPQPDTLKAREGTAAHWYLAEALHKRPPSVGALAPNGHPVTEEMTEWTEAMIADALPLMAKPSVHFAIEQQLKMPQVHPTLNWGTADLVMIDHADKVLYGWDFKSGHRYVDVFENWQLVDYLIGAANAFHLDLHAAEGWTIDARIYQPRSFHADGPVKVWRCDAPRLLTLAHKLAVAAAEAAKPNAPARTGEYCLDCPGALGCDAFKATIDRAIDVSRVGPPQEIALPQAGVALHVIRQARERLEDMESALEARLISELKAGRTLPGWQIEQGYGREKWTVPAQEVFALGTLFGVEVAKLPEPVTPAQARKLGIDAAVISAYSTKPPGEMKLKPVDDTKARKVFEQ